MEKLRGEEIGENPHYTISLLSDSESPPTEISGINYKAIGGTYF